jgi:hypothetical protein
MPRFLKTHDHNLINAAIVERIEFEIVDGQDGARAVLNGGAIVRLEGTFTEARVSLLPVVAAAPGLMALNYQDDERCAQPIVAWAIDGDSADPVSAGVLNKWDTPGVLFFDGRVFDPRDGRTYPDETAWRAARRPRLRSV